MLVVPCTAAAAHAISPSATAAASHGSSARTCPRIHRAVPLQHSTFAASAGRPAVASHRQRRSAAAQRAVAMRMNDPPAPIIRVSCSSRPKTPRSRQFGIRMRHTCTASANTIANEGPAPFRSTPHALSQQLPQLLRTDRSWMTGEASCTFRVLPVGRMWCCWAGATRMWRCCAASAWRRCPACASPSSPPAWPPPTGAPARHWCTLHRGRELRRHAVDLRRSRLRPLSDDCAHIAMLVRSLR